MTRLLIAAPLCALLLTCGLANGPSDDNPVITLRVWIVEDSPVCALLARQAVTQAQRGWVADIAVIADESAALNHLKTEAPHIAILDWSAGAPRIATAMRGVSTITILMSAKHPITRSDRGMFHQVVEKSCGDDLLPLLSGAVGKWARHVIRTGY